MKLKDYIKILFAGGGAWDFLGWLLIFGGVYAAFWIAYLVK